MLGKVNKAPDIEASKADYEKFVQYGNVSFVYIRHYIWWKAKKQRKSKLVDINLPVSGKNIY